ncbi:substrate-binding periplasmic protein [Alteromonas halophila]|uniref:substrate-binding periplasmic protein n=1 Tax=Alteromonas halophila TaxID=516698 RepID=UPI00167C44DB|nr:ABC transporter substrate-binding protein [Alteromonas halophila]
MVLISVLKTPARESEFQWLGLVHVARASFIRLTAREQLYIDSPEQARQYRVGTIRGYGAASYLKKQGFVENENLFLATNPEQLWSMLYSQRIDLVLSNLETDRYEIASIGLDPDKVTAIHNVEALNLQLQMATGLSTPEDTVESIRKALHQLKEGGDYERIMQKWGLL